MKNSMRNIKQGRIVWMFFGGFILCLGISSFATLDRGFDRLSQQMLWAITLFFLCMWVAIGIIRYIDNSTNNILVKTKDEENALDISPIAVFFQTQARNDARIASVLEKIRNHVWVLSPRINELDIEQQHHVERLINKNLRDLLTHYQRFSMVEQNAFEKELLESLMYIEKTLEQVYLNELNKLSIYQFEKTRNILVK